MSPDRHRAAGALSFVLAAHALACYASGRMAIHLPKPRPRRDIPTPLDPTPARRVGRRRSAEIASRSTADEDLQAQHAVERAVRDANASLAATMDPAEVAALGGRR